MDRFETFSLALFNMSRYWNRLAAEEMEKYGLKGAHAFYLVTVLRYNGEITASQLCDLCGKDKADVSRGVSRLEAIGMLRRVGSNPYRAKLQLTEQGIAAAQAVRETAQTIVDRVGGDLSPEDRAVFYEVLASVTANLEKLCKET